MSDEKNRELSPEDLNDVSGGGGGLSSPSSKEQKTPFQRSPIPSDVDDAAGDDYGTPGRRLGDAASQKGK